MARNDVVLISAALAAIGVWVANGLSETPNQIMGQKVVEELKASHPEITGLELASSRSEKEGCRTIAATESKEIGEKCDEDEFTAMKTNQPFVEDEKQEFDATLPLHDSNGKVIGTAGMDFKKERNQNK